jgi:hypothetical protein
MRPTTSDTGASPSTPRACAAAGKVDHPPAHERAAVVDAHHDRAAVVAIDHGHFSAERQGAVRCRQGVGIHRLPACGLTVAIYRREPRSLVNSLRLVLDRRVRCGSRNGMRRRDEPVAQVVPLRCITAPCPGGDGTPRMPVGRDASGGPVGLSRNRPKGRARCDSGYGARHEHVSKDTSMTRVMSQYEFLSLGAG